MISSITRKTTEEPKKERRGISSITPKGAYNAPVQAMPSASPSSANAQWSALQGRILIPEQVDALRKDVNNQRNAQWQKLQENAGQQMPDAGSFGQYAGDYATEIDANRLAVAEQELKMQGAERQLGTYGLDIQSMENRMADLYERAASGDAAAIDEYNRLRDQYLASVQNYNTAVQSANGLNEAYKAAADKYKGSVDKFNAYTGSESARYDAWRSSVRDEDTILKEIAELDKKIDAVGQAPESQTHVVTFGGMQGAAVPTEDAKTELRGLMEQKAKLQQELAESRYLRYSDISGSDDFKAWREADPTAYGVAGYRDYDKQLIDAQNTMNETENDPERQDEYMAAQKAYTTALALQNSTDEEAKMYDYLLSTEGQEAADAYLAYLAETLNAREGEQQVRYLEDVHGILRPVAYGAFAAAAGLDQWAQGTAQMANAVFGNGEALPTSALQYGASEVSSKLDNPDSRWDWKKWAFGAVQNIANQVPHWAAGAVLGPWAGSAVMGMSAGGNAYNNAVKYSEELGKAGMTRNQAMTMAMLTAASETMLERLLDGVYLKGGITTGLEKVTEKIGSAFWRNAAKFGIDFMSEEIEETLQDFLEPAFESMITGETYNAPDFDEVLDTIIITAITTAVAGGGRQAVTLAQQKQTGKALNKIRVTDELIDSALKLDKDTDAYKTAERMKNGKRESGDTNVGELYTQYVQADGDVEFVKRAQNAYNVVAGTVQLALTKAGADEKTANRIAPIITDIMTGTEISGNEAAKIARSDAAVSMLENMFGVEIDTDAPIRNVKEAIKGLARSVNESNASTTDNQTPAAQIAQTASPAVSPTKRMIEEYTTEAKLGEVGKAIFNDRYIDGQDAEGYIRDMMRAYSAGRDGKTIAGITSLTATEDQLKAANEAGMADAKAVATDNTAAASMDLADERSFYNGEGNDAVREGSAGDLSQRAGERDGAVSGRTEAVGRERRSGAQTERGRRESTENVRTRKVKATSLFASAKKNANAEVTDEAPTRDMRAARSLAKKNGYELTSFRGEIELENKQTNGRRDFIRGFAVIGTKRIGAQFDNPYAAQADIARHEIMEQKIGDGEVRVDDVIARAEKYVDPEKLQQMINFYDSFYPSPKQEHARSEVVCDGADHINQAEHLGPAYADLVPVFDEALNALNRAANELTDGAFELDETQAVENTAYSQQIGEEDDGRREQIQTSGTDQGGRRAQLAGGRQGDTAVSETKRSPSGLGRDSGASRETRAGSIRRWSELTDYERGRLAEYLVTPMGNSAKWQKSIAEYTVDDATEILLDILEFDEDVANYLRETVPGFAEGADKALDFLNRQKRETARKKSAVSQKSASTLTNEKNSEGKSLSQGQAAYFADSKIRDKDGALLVLYHGSRSAAFSVFDMYEGIWLATSRAYAEVYAENWRSWREEMEQNGLEEAVYDDPDLRVYSVYANGTNGIELGEIDTAMSEGFLRSLAKKAGVEYRTLRSLADLYMEENVYTFTRSHEFIALMKDRGFDYMHATEKGRDTYCVIQSPDQVKLTRNLTPTKSDDVRFSMELPVEETENLVALHNINAEKLGKALDLGGFPMPSIAVTKTGIPHTNFGDITLVMNKSAIDPQANRRNTVYSADAWTPTFPTVEYEADEKTAARLRRHYYDMRSKYGDDAVRPLYAWGNYADDELTRRGGVENVIEGYRDDPDMMKLYLLENGLDVPAPVTNERVSRLDDQTIAMYDHFIRALGEDAINELVTRDGEGPVQTRKRWWEDHGEDFEAAYKDYMLTLGFTEEEIDNVLSNESLSDQTRKVLQMRNYLRTGPETRTTETDVTATNDAIRAAVDAKKYDAWLHGLFDGLEKSKGIYNGKERFTPSGNTRSFSATHYEATLENIARAMAAENNGNSRNVSGFYGVKSLRAGMAKRFSSIAEMHKYEGRLQHLTEEEAQKITDALSDRMMNVMGRIYDTKTHDKYENSFIEMDRIGEDLMEITEQKKITVDSIEKIFEKYGYKIGNELAADVRDLLFDVAQMPVNMFEAKPERAVRFNEVMAAVVPSDTDEALVQRLRDAGVNVLTYEAGNDEDRMAKANSVEDARFSREITLQDADVYNRTVVLKDSTVDQYLKDYASETSPNYAQAYVTRMSPSAFLDLTTSRIGRSRISQETGELDTDQLEKYNARNPIFLTIDHTTGDVVGHEGRHRMMALDRAGIRSVPVLLFDSSNKNGKTALDSLELHGQDFGTSRSYANVTVHNVQPLSYGNRDNVVEAVATQPTNERIAENYGRNTIRYSREMDLSDVTPATRKESLKMEATDDRNVARYRNEITEALDGTMKSNQLILLGRPSAILAKHLGSESPLYMPQSAAKKAALPANVKGGKHGLGRVVLDELPYQFEDPMAITGNTTQHEALGDNSIVVWTDWKTEAGDSVIVPIRINANGTVGVFNSVNTAFDLFNPEYMSDLLRKGNILYTQNEKSIDELLAQRRQVPKWKPDDAFSDDSIRETGEKVNGKFSRELTPLENLRIQNEHLQEQVEYWKGQTKRSDRAEIDRKAVEKAVKALARSYGIRLTDEESSILTRETKRLYDYMSRGYEGDDELTWSDAQMRAYAIADRLVEQATAVDDTMYQQYKDLRDYLRKTSFKISPTESHDIADFNDWRRSLRGRVKVGLGDTNVDRIYQEMSEMWPDFFNSEEQLTPIDQLLHIADVADIIHGKTNYNPFSPYLREAKAQVADDILEQFFETPQVKKTFADRQAEKLEAAKEHGREQVRRLREQKNARIEEIREQGRQRVRDAIARERELRNEQLQRMKDHQRAVRERATARRLDSAARTRLLKIARRLQNMKLPAVSRALLNEYIGDLDTVAKSMTGKTLEKLTDLREWYDERKENDPDFIADPGIEKAIARLAKKHISDLSAEEVAELTNVLLNIENELRTERKLIDAEDRRDTYLMGEDVIRNVYNTRGSKGSFLDKYIVTETLSPLREARRLTGYVDNDPLVKLTEDLAAGQRKMFDYQMRAERPAQKFAEDKAFSRMFSGKDAQGIQITGISKDGPKTVTITPAMRTSLYLHSLNDQNLRHIRDGGITVPNLELYRKGDIAEAYARGDTIKLTPSQVRAITAGMTAQERAFAKMAHDYFNGQSRNEINETSEKLKGFSIAQVEDYFPINTDSSFTKRDFEALKFDGTLEGMGFLKERVNAANPIMLRDVNDVLQQSIRQHAKYVGLAIPVRNFSKVWGVTTASFNEDGSRNSYESSVQQAIKKQWGTAAYDYIEKMMTDLQNGQDAKKNWAKALGKIRGNYAKAVLTLNPSVAMKQAASYPTAAAVLGWAPLVKAMGDVGKVDLDLIAKYTPLQWYRSQGYSTQELGDLKKANRQLPAILNWVQGVDLLTTRKLWKASEYYVRAEIAKAAAETSVIRDYQRTERHGETLDKVRSHLSEIKTMAPVASITGDEFQKTENDTRKLGEKVLDFFDSIGNRVFRSGMGNIELNNAGVHDSLAHGYGKLKAASFAALPDVLKNGKLIEQRGPYAGHNYDSYYIAAPITVGEDGEVCYVGALVIRDEKMQRYKLHEVLVTNKNGTPLFQSESGENAGPLRNGAPQGNPDGSLNSDGTISQRLKNVKIGSDAYYKAVADVYNRVIEETQPNYTSMQRPQLLRSDDTLLGNVMMFKTQPFQNFNILYDAAANLEAKTRQGDAAAIKEAKTNFARAVSSQIVQLAVFAAMTALWAGFRGKGDKYKDEDGETSILSVLKALGKDMVGGLFGDVPLGSEAWELASSKLFGDKYYGLDAVTITAISDTVTSLVGLSDLIGKVATSVAAGEDVNMNSVRIKADGYFDDISKVLGVPYENVANLFNAVARRVCIKANGKYVGTYQALKMTTDPDSKKAQYYDNLYKAYVNDPEAFSEIYADMIAGGQFTEKQIKGAMEDRMKAEQGVPGVKDLENRFLAPEQQVRYDATLQQVQQSDLWYQADERQRGDIEDVLYELAAGTSAGQTMQAKIDVGEAYGVSETDYLLYQLALEMADQPTDSGKYGTYTGDEVQAAIDMLKGLSDDARGYLWIAQGKAEKSNPYGSADGAKDALTEKKQETAAAKAAEKEEEQAPAGSQSADVSSSSMFSAASYDPATQTVTLTFRGSGKTYTYEDISESEWAAFQAAPSKGSYFNQHWK